MNEFEVIRYHVNPPLHKFKPDGVRGLPTTPGNLNPLRKTFGEALYGSNVFEDNEDWTNDQDPVKEPFPQPWTGKTVFTMIEKEQRCEKPQEGRGMPSFWVRCSWGLLDLALARLGTCRSSRGVASAQGVSLPQATPPRGFKKKMREMLRSLRASCAWLRIVSSCVPSRLKGSLISKSGKLHDACVVFLN